MITKEELEEKKLGELFRLRNKLLEQAVEVSGLSIQAIIRTKKERDAMIITEEHKKAIDNVRRALNMIEEEIKNKRQEYKRELEKNAGESFEKLANEIEKLEMERDEAEKQAKYFIVDEVLKKIIRGDAEKNAKKEGERRFKNAKELEKRIRHLKKAIETYKKKAEKEEEKMMKSMGIREIKGQGFTMLDSPYAFRQKNVMLFAKKAANAKIKLRVHEKRKKGRMKG